MLRPDRINKTARRRCPARLTFNFRKRQIGFAVLNFLFFMLNDPFKHILHREILIKNQICVQFNHHW